MSFSQTDSSKKFLSMPTVVSSFVGIMLAVPLAFAISGPMQASAADQTGQAVTAQANVDDFALFAQAFNQGYDAKVANATSTGGGGATCAEATATVAGGQGSGQLAGVASTSQSNVYRAPAVGGKGGGVMPGKTSNKVSEKMSERTKAMVQSFYNYTSMTNNSSTVNNTHTTTNTNSNNTVGSNNSTKTELNVDANKTRGDVVVGVTNESTSVQENINESFNKDSYNTKTDTTIINDSFKKDSENTTTVTTDIDVNKETYVDKSRETNVDIHKETNVEVNRETNVTRDSNNTENNNSNNNVEVNADVDILSDNEVEVTLPEGEEA